MNPLFDIALGVGPRGFLGGLPEPTAESVSEAMAHGVARWGQSICIRRTVEEAAEHDAQFDGLYKILYFISDLDITNLGERAVVDGMEAVADEVQARFAELLHGAQIVYFDHAGAHHITAEDARRVFDPAHVTLTEDGRGLRLRGLRFTQDGWCFPATRGVMLYDTVFDRSSKTLKRTLERARALENKGYTTTFNTDFGAALKKVRDQVRVYRGDDGKPVLERASRYNDREMLKVAIDGYNNDTCFSVEVRDPGGQLLAGALMTRGGNVFSLDTVFYDYVTEDDTRVVPCEELRQVADASGLKSLLNHGKLAFLGASLAWNALLPEHGWFAALEPTYLITQRPRPRTAVVRTR